MSIGDVNALPTFTPTSICTDGRSLPENTVPTSFGAHVNALDPDDNDQLTITMVTSSDGKFGITTPTARTGSGPGNYVFQAQVKSLQLLDYEAGTNQYTVRVRVADDKVIPGTIECDMIITLTNVNESPSGAFTLLGVPLSVQENALPHTLVGSLIFE